MEIVLYEPEIPGNTGNIARLCAANHMTLHLIKPLGFSIDDKHVKRAGLDYWHLVDVQVHENIQELYEKYQASLQPLTYDSTYKLAKTFETSNGEYVEMRVDFMENTIEIDSIHFSTHGEVDFDSITIVDKEEYERLKESSGVLNVLIQSLDKGAAIKKIKNGYIIDDMYYESLEEFLDINEK